MDINSLFKLGMKRDIPALIPHGKECINLGAGNSHLPFAASLDLPQWDAEVDPIPYQSNSLDTIFAFHFFEHLSGKHAIRMLKECERVLVVGGTLNVVVPHRTSQLAYEDLDHKSFFCEETWRNLFRTSYYIKNREEGWKFEIRTNIIIGLSERNLALMTQLQRIA